MVYKLDFLVRSYECDLQGIVNNAQYMHYLEHCRHEFLKNHGINFADMHQKGLDLVVVRAELDYKQSLKNDDEFYVTCFFEESSRVKFKFLQRIYKKDDESLVMEAEILGACIHRQRNKPVSYDFFKSLIQSKTN